MAAGSPPKLAATSGANAAKLEKAPTPDPVRKVTAPTMTVRTVVMPPIPSPKPLAD